MEQKLTKYGKNLGHSKNNNKISEEDISKSLEDNGSSLNLSLEKSSEIVCLSAHSEIIVPADLNLLSTAVVNQKVKLEHNNRTVCDLQKKDDILQQVKIHKENITILDVSGIYETSHISGKSESHSNILQSKLLSSRSDAILDVSGNYETSHISGISESHSNILQSKLLSSRSDVNNILSDCSENKILIDNCFPSCLTCDNLDNMCTSNFCHGINANFNENLIDSKSNYTAKQLQNEMLESRYSKNQHNTVINDLMHALSLIEKRNLLLTHLENELLNKLFENKENQQYILSNICVHKKSVTPSKQYTLFGMPYFKDWSGSTPSHNEDYNKKMEKGVLILSSIPRVHFWKRHEKDLLLEGIKLILIKENSQKLSEEIVKLKEILQLVTTDDERCKVLEKLLKLQDMLQSLKHCSYKTLACKEDKDKEYDWNILSESLFNGIHSPEQCRRYWNVFLKPSINKNKWKKRENNKLISIAEQMQSQDWDNIAQLLGTNRTAYQCLVQYKSQLKPIPGVSSEKWTQKEDDKLLALVNSTRMGNFIPWQEISFHLDNRTPPQIYRRWISSLNPKRRRTFTKKEDLLIVAGIEVFGADYLELSSLMSHRSCDEIQERYERYLLSNTRKVGTWSLEEDNKLLRLVKKYGKNKWFAVAAEMRTRSRTQVRQRYNFIKHMMSKNPDWTVKGIKRKHRNNDKIVFKKYQVMAKKLKNEMNHMEKMYNLSQREKDSVRIQQLKKLRDICLKRYVNNSQRNKMQFIVKEDEINSYAHDCLLEYFKCDSSDYLPNLLKKPQKKYYKRYLDECFLLSNYFGHKLNLPKCKTEIQNNPRLSRKLKHFLCETFSKKNVSFANATEFPVDLTYQHNIDYVSTDIDDTLIMKKWWHTSPIDVTKFSFSDFFKYTLFDYSVGVHNDIWISKNNRSINANVFYNIDETPPTECQIQSSYTPPNLLNTLGIRTIFLSLTRLKQKPVNLIDETTPERTEPNMTINTDVNTKLKDLLFKFQKTINNLFTWPRVLSVTNLGPTSKAKRKFAYHQRLDSNYTTSVTTDIFQHVLKPLIYSDNSKPQQQNVQHNDFINRKQNHVFRMKKQIHNEVVKEIVQDKGNKVVNGNILEFTVKYSTGACISSKCKVNDDNGLLETVKTNDSKMSLKGRKRKNKIRAYLLRKRMKLLKEAKETEEHYPEQSKKVNVVEIGEIDDSNLQCVQKTYKRH